MHIRDLFSLDGKVALVTGGGRGLGAYMSVALAEAGADVALCSRKVENCEKVAEQIESMGRKTLALPCDIRQPDDILRTVETVVREFGKVDILINNSGTVWGALPEEMPLEGWNKVMETNVTGVFLMTQAAGRHMIRRQSGKIINMASVMAFRSQEIAIGYNTSKGAIVSFTIDLANAWAKHNIHVNAIAPGWFPTDMGKMALDPFGDYWKNKIPLRRFGTEDDLKGAAVFLASDASNYITGHVLVVDGGMLTV